MRVTRPVAEDDKSGISIIGAWASGLNGPISPRLRAGAAANHDMAQMHVEPTCVLILSGRRLALSAREPCVVMKLPHVGGRIQIRAVLEDLPWRW